mgnify:CR=1 FL=1
MAVDAFCLILAMLGLGMALGRTSLLPANAPETLNLVVLYVCLPAAVLTYVPRLHLDVSLLGIAATPWLLMLATLAILVRSGVPLVEALAIGAEVVSNLIIRSDVANATQRVREGGSLSRALEASRQFPPMMLHMIASGERSGELDQMLSRTARNQENDLAATIGLLVGLFEPFMLVFMGAVVLVIVLAILMPILSLNQLVG